MTDGLSALHRSTDKFDWNQFFLLVEPNQQRFKSAYEDEQRMQQYNIDRFASSGFEEEDLMDPFCVAWFSWTTIGGFWYDFPYFFWQFFHIILHIFRTCVAVSRVDSVHSCSKLAFPAVKKWLQIDYFRFFSVTCWHFFLDSSLLLRFYQF